VKLNTDLIALGASAVTHYPPIANAMAVALTVPDNADVAGAVGAAAGSVRQRVMVSITQPAETKFAFTLPMAQLINTALMTRLPPHELPQNSLPKRAQKAPVLPKLMSILKKI
jgi:hypothetical protein